MKPSAPTRQSRFRGASKARPWKRGAVGGGAIGVVSVRSGLAGWPHGGLAMQLHSHALSARREAKSSSVSVNMWASLSQAVNSAVTSDERATEETSSDTAPGSAGDVTGAVEDATAGSSTDGGGVWGSFASLAGGISAAVNEQIAQQAALLEQEQVTGWNHSPWHDCTITALPSRPRFPMIANQQMQKKPHCRGSAPPQKSRSRFEPCQRYAAVCISRH